MTDYKIHEVDGRLWAAELDGVELGSSPLLREVVGLLEREVAKRLPPYWGIRVWDAGDPERQELALCFLDPSGIVETDLDKPSVAALVAYAWDEFIKANPGWASIRPANQLHPEAPAPTSGREQS